MMQQYEYFVKKYQARLLKKTKIKQEDKNKTRRQNKKIYIK